ncbi:importin-5 [Lepeophtheirus salmonis]|uniref:importin-5 n=1 Tax=Lepeophtheirus salmonis TaxID=72036 RepID=UPI001AE5EE11|nr:importin-5-like [Lepeophtheirus salmonis]
MSGPSDTDLILALLSTDNDIRSAAEKKYEELESKTKFLMLFERLSNKQNLVAVEGRQLCAVLLRQLFSADFEKLFTALGADQEHFKNECLEALHREPDKTVRKKMGDMVAEVAINLIDVDGNNRWPQFLKFLFDSTNSPNAEIKEIAFHLFSSVPSVFGNQEAEHFDTIKQMLMSGLMDPNHIEVRTSAARASIKFLLTKIEDPPAQKRCQDMLTPILTVTMETITKGVDDTVFKALVELAEGIPKYLRAQLDQLYGEMIKLFSNVELCSNWRYLALEVVVTLSETAPSMVRNVAGNHIGTVVQNILKMMMEIEDEDDWATSDELANEDSDSHSIVAESALDRLACALGGKTIFPHILSCTPTILQQPDWKCRHAALMAISASGEGCHKQMEEYLPQIMEGVMNFVNDPHPRVRYACCQAIGQMSTDFAPCFEKKFHDKVIPGLLHLMDDSANPRVQAHAGAALVNFSEDCPKNILTPYLDPIIQKLEEILSSKFRELVEKGNKMVLEQIVTTIASVADTAEEKFVNYYDRFFPCLKYIIQNANTPELRLLRGKTIECISLIGLAIGGEKFVADAGDIMDLLLKTQTEEPNKDIPDDDPQMSYILAAWARICKILGSGFAPYLPLVMGPIMKAVSSRTEVVFLKNDELENEDDMDDWTFVSLGNDENFGIRTTGLEEKAAACQMLVCYARELKEHFVDYVEDTVKLMVPMLKFLLHDKVRSTAADSFPCLLECARIRGPEYLQSTWEYICPNLLTAIAIEVDVDVKIDFLRSLARCIELLGMGCLNNEQMQELLGTMIKSFTGHFERQEERLAKRKEEDYDEGVEEKLEDQNDDDVYILERLGDIIHVLFATHKDGFLPVFNQILPFAVKLLGQDHPWTDQQWGLCIFDDLIEYTGPASLNYQEHFLNPMLHYVNSPVAEVRQAAAYGCGVMGQFGGPSYAQIVSQAIPLLVKAIQEKRADTDFNNPTENAISAVTKILKWNATAVNVDEILLHWISWLPVYEDLEESPYIYAYLADLVESNDPRILGANNDNLPKIIALIAESFCLCALPTDCEAYIRLVNLVKHVQFSSAQLFEVCLTSLSEPQKRALSEALAAVPVAAAP